MGKRLITADEVRRAARSGSRTLEAPAGQCIVTPMAADEAAALGVRLVTANAGATAARRTTDTPTPTAPELARQVLAQLQARLPVPVDAQRLRQIVESATAARLEGRKATAPPAPPAAEAGRVIEGVIGQLGARIPAGVSADRLRQLVREAVAARLGGALPADAREGTAGQAVRCIRTRLQPSDNGPIAGAATLARIQDTGPEAALTGGVMAWEQATYPREVSAPEMAVVIEGELHLTVDGRTLVGGPGDLFYLPGGSRVTLGTPSRVKLACVRAAG